MALVLMIVLSVLVATGVGTEAQSADPTQLIYDWEQPAGEPRFVKPQVPAPKSTQAVPRPLNRERWKKSTSQPYDMTRDKFQAVQPPKSGESNLPKVDVPVNQNNSESGPVVVGRVVYHGSVPPPEQVEVTRDVEVCGPVVNVAPLSVDPASHGVRNAVVYVGIGQPLTEQAPMQVSVVQNKKCAFYPRVAASRAGSLAEISNDDPLMHNTNMTVNSRTVLNVALVAGGNSIRKPLKTAGLHLIKCNVHKFMQAYRYVFEHPFFSQTNDVGQFQIPGLSPGLQTVSAWHETLGVLQKEVHVPAHGAVTVDFEFQ